MRVRFEPPNTISSGESLTRYLVGLVDKLNTLVSELDKKNTESEQSTTEVQKELKIIAQKVKGLQSAVDEIKESI